MIYVEADKEKYYARKEEERKRRLLENAYVKAAVGANLVNVYFQPCCEEYGYTEIDFYVTKNKTSNAFSFSAHFKSLVAISFEFGLKFVSFNESIITSACPVSSVN